MAKGKLSVRVRLVAVSLAVLAALPAAPAAAQSVRERELTSSGAWSWFGDPRSVYFDGAHRRTYTGWVSTSGSVQVAATTTTPACGRSPPSRPAPGRRPRQPVDPGPPRRPAAGVLADPCRRQHVVPGARPGRGHHRLGAGAGLPHSTPRHPRLHLPQPGAAVGRGQPHLPVLARQQPQPVVLDLQQRHQLERGPDADPEPGERPYVKYAGNGRDTIAMPSPAHRAWPTNIHYVAYQPGRCRRRVGHHQHGQPAHHPGPGGAGPQLADQRARPGSATWPWTTPVTR